MKTILTTVVLALFASFVLTTPVTAACSGSKCDKEKKAEKEEKAEKAK